MARSSTTFKPGHPGMGGRPKSGGGNKPPESVEVWPSERGGVIENDEKSYTGSNGKFRPGNPGKPPGARDRIPRGLISALLNEYVGKRKNVKALLHTLEKAQHDPRYAVKIVELVGDRLEGKPKQEVEGLVRLPLQIVHRSHPPHVDPLADSPEGSALPSAQADPDAELLVPQARELQEPRR